MCVCVHIHTSIRWRRNTHTIHITSVRTHTDLIDRHMERRVALPSPSPKKELTDPLAVEEERGEEGVIDRLGGGWK